MIFKPGGGMMKYFSCFVCDFFIISPHKIYIPMIYIRGAIPMSVYRWVFTKWTISQLNVELSSCGHSYTLVQWDISLPFSVPISSWFSCDSSWSVESSTGTRYEAGAQPIIPDASAIHHPVWTNTHKQYSPWQWMWVNHSLRNTQYTTFDNNMWNATCTDNEQMNSTP